MLFNIRPLADLVIILPISPQSSIYCTCLNRALTVCQPLSKFHVTFCLQLLSLKTILAPQNTFAHLKLNINVEVLNCIVLITFTIYTSSQFADLRYWEDEYNPLANDRAFKNPSYALLSQYIDETDSDDLCFFEDEELNQKCKTEFCRCTQVLQVDLHQVDMNTDYNDDNIDNNNTNDSIDITIMMI